MSWGYQPVSYSLLEWPDFTRVTDHRSAWDGVGVPGLKRFTVNTSTVLSRLMTGEPNSNNVRDYNGNTIVINIISDLSACNSGGAGDAGDEGSIPGSERSPGPGHRNPLQHFCLENHLDRGAWMAMVHGVAKSQTLLKQLSMHTCTHHVSHFPSALLVSSDLHNNPDDIRIIPFHR